MSYNTDLMQEILTSEAARDIVNQLSPIYGEARVALWLFQAIGAELDPTREWTKELAAQAVPHTATWTIDQWEDEHGVPRDPTLGLQKRRERVINKRRDRAPMNPYTLERIASAAAENAEARVEERTGAGSVFTVWIDAMPSDTDKAKIIAAVKKAKQSRLSFLIKYEQFNQGAIHTAGHLQMSYDITIRQV